MNWTTILARPFNRPAATASASNESSSYTVTQPDPGGSAQPASRLGEADSATRARVADAYGRLPLSFEANHGQTDPRVKFLSRGSGYALFLTATESVLVLNGPPMKTSPVSQEVRTVKQRSAAVRIKLAGANSLTKLEGIDELPGKSNYFIGKDTRRWRTNVPNYARVQYRSVYPGVDLIYYGNQDRIEFDFVVAAGADYRNIKFEIKGARKTRVDEGGDLVLATSMGEVRQHRPLVYQDVGGTKRVIPSQYVFDEKRRVGFEVGKYDKSRTLIIDPVISYSTYLGGNTGAGVTSVAVDQAGSAYVTGNTGSTNFPVTANAYRTVRTTSSDIYVTKLNSTGTAFLFSSYLAGGIVDAIAVDNANNAYITGIAASPDFPSTPNAYQTISHGGGDAFVAKVNTNPSSCTPAPTVNCTEALAYSTFIGGAADDRGFGIAADSSGNAYVAGQTFSNDFPTTPGAIQPAYQGGFGDGFVTKVNPTGGALAYSTYLGGAFIHLVNTGEDRATSISVDASGSAYVTGWTNSASFPTTPGAFRTSCTNCGTFNPSAEAIYDAFVTKVNAAGTGLAYSTYLGGSRQDLGSALTVDSSGHAYVTGRADSFDFPTTVGALSSGSGGVLKSADGGINWKATGSGIATTVGDTVTALAVDPTNPSTIYAGVFSFNGPSGVFKSIDGGSNWTAINSGLTATNIRALAIAPTVTPTIYAGLDVAGIYKSTDGGENWFSVNTDLLDNSIASLAVDPRNPSVVYAGGNNSGVSKSTDGGAHWSYTGGPGSNTLCLAFDPVNPTTIYAGRTNSVDRSTNGGATWDYIGQGISHPNGTTVKALAIDPTATNKIYAATDKGVFRTANAASTPWTLSNTGLTSTDVRALVIDRMNTSTLYAGTANGIFKSIDGGSSWKPHNSGLVGSLIVSLALDPAITSTVYAGTLGGSSIFVTKLSGSGAALSYSTFLAFGTNNSIAVDNTGSAYVTGSSPGGFPTTQDAFRRTNVGDDAFVAKLSTTGSNLLFSTYLGGNSSDRGFDIATDASGNVYTAGWTDSSDFTTTPGVVQPVKPGINSQGFITRMAFPLAANYDQYSTNPDTGLAVSAPGVLGNDTNVTQSAMTASLVSGASSGSLTLSPNGSFTYTPNPNFVGYDSFEYKAQDGSSQSNIATVVVGVKPQCLFDLSSSVQTLASTGGASSVDVTTGSQCQWRAFSNVPSFITITSGASGSTSGTVSFSVAANSSGMPRTGTMTVAEDILTITQAGPPSTATIGVYFSSNQTFYLRNTNSPGFADFSIQYGPPGAIPLVGDWDGNGSATIGVYDPNSQTFYLRNSNTPGFADLTVRYGPPGAIPLAGDWNADGVATIGVYDPASQTFYLRNSNSPGFADLTIRYGPPAAVPIVGDWDRNGTTTIGVYDPGSQTFYLRNSNTIGFADLTIGYGPPGATPVVGDWDANGTVTIGVYDPGSQTFYLRNSNTIGFADLTIRYGPSGATPLAGDWNGL